MDPAKLKVVDLRVQLSQRGLDTKGNKAVLVERLRKALEEENATQDEVELTANADSILETTVKENNEKSAESAKPPQTPKSSGRASRSSSVTTPTKISTRSAPKTSMTPRAMKQLSPSKAQQMEVPNETLAMVPESVSEDQTVLRDEKTVIMAEKYEKSPNLQNESHSSFPMKGEDESNILDVTEGIKSEANISQVSVIKSPKKSSEFLEASSEKVQDDMDRIEQSQELAVAPVREEEIPENEQMVEKSKNINDNEEDQILEDTDLDDTLVEKSREEECSIEQKDTMECLENTNDIGNTGASEIKPLIIDLADEEQSTNNDLNDKVEILEESLESTDKKSVNVADNIEDIGENIDERESQEVVEMTEVEQAENSKVITKDLHDKNEIKDRKRKRSQSPAQVLESSPVSVVVENEPEIDYSALILSWYDSDLNLIIDKNGFFTATPMHNDGFSHMWAGARASHGFLRGKVYYETKVTEHCSVNMKNEEHPHILKVGWSAANTSMQLGEDKFSYGYDSTGKKSTDNLFEDYGLQFGKDDVIGCYLDASSESSVVLSYTVNGKDQGTAFCISKEELGDKPLFPHILSKNCRFACNFGQEKPWNDEILQDYTQIGNVDSEYKVPGPRRPEKKEECEVIMMCGLPASGKTTWALKHATDHPQKMYNILGLSNLIDKMKDMGLPYKKNYSGQWEILINKCLRALDKLLEIAPNRRRNYILDQTNVYSSVQRRKMKNFSGYQRKAIVIVPTEEESKLRATNHKPIEGKEITDSALLEMKATLTAPVVGEYFDAVDWVAMNMNDGKKLIEKYNKEGKEAGYGQHQASKRPRVDFRPDSSRDNRDTRSNRDVRDTRDHRERRGNYPERNRNAHWRGGGNMGWRDRPQRGGHVRGGYGAPVPWRARNMGVPVSSAHRGLDRRGGGGDRRPGNDRGRAPGSRQGGWAPMSNYQGSQQPVWNQQSNWSGGQSQGGWGQQSGWGAQQWSNWKGYGQGSYNQTNYNQQGYGNGNWNSSWNQQYYNQYWSQQQQSGQTTAAGGQAIGTTESVTAASSGDSTTGYSYQQQDWQGYTQEYNSGQSVVSTNQRFRQHK